MYNDDERTGVPGAADRDAAARAQGWCCAEDADAGPCRHLRELARTFAAESRAEVAEELRREGLPGLIARVEAGDPVARELWDMVGGPPDDGGQRRSGEPPIGDSAGPAPGDGSPSARPEESTTMLPAGADDAAAPSRRRRLDRPVADVLAQVEREASVGLGVPVGVLAALPSDTHLAALVAGLDVRELGPLAGVEVVAAWKRVEAWAAGQAARAAAAVADQPCMRSVHTGTGETVDASAEELAMRLAVTRQEAARLVRVGRGLNGRFSATAEALETGLLDFRKAATIITSLDDSPGIVGFLAEQEVLDDAAGHTHGQVQRRITRALISVDGADARDRHRRARCRRHVNRPQPLPDGMARISAVLPASDCVQIDLVLDAAARSAKARGDKRTTDQLRADALVTMAVGAVETGWVGTPPTGAVAARTVPETSGAASSGARTATAAGGAEDGGDLPLGALLPRRRPMRLGSERAQVRITVPLSVALGRDLEDNPDGGPEPERCEVAELEGYGPVTGDVARAIACGGTWRRIVTDPLTGQVLDIGRRRYRPPADLARLVQERDGTCTRPGCSTPASRCQLDHIVPWSQGGPTAAWDLHSQCHRDHVLKTAGLLHVVQPSRGTFEWLTPSGHCYRRHPDGHVTMLDGPSTALLPAWQRRYRSGPPF